MTLQKKHGKGRLDKWYKLAKQKGYRARAAFKLIQLNRKYKFLENSKVLIDLCAAPGSWCQVAVEAMPAQSLIIGVDLAPIKPIPKVITFQSDITTEKCRATIRQHLKTWKADTVLHDGAPNVGTAWVQDAFTQAQLVLQSLKLATEFLIQGGTFVTKVFRSRDFNALMWVFNQLFDKVEATKPPSSRNVSAEIFVVCKGYKAPKKIDPKFLDPRSVFEELPDPTPNNEAKVFKPEVKKRKRDGYEEGDYTQYKECPVTDFVETTDPIQFLGTMNRFTFKQQGNGDIAMAAADKLPETTAEIRACCEDLKILGKRDFRLLLKWRLRVRELFGFSTKEVKAAKTEEDAVEKAEVMDIDEDLKIAQEIQNMRDNEQAEKKRKKRRENEQKQKDIRRFQLHMIAPTEVGLEQEGPLGEDAMFRLKQVDKVGGLNKIVKGKMNFVIEPEEMNKNWDIYLGSKEEEIEFDEEGEANDYLEEELEAMYEQYQEKKAQADAKYRAKKARKETEDGEWTGFASDKEDSGDDDVVMHDDNDYFDDDIDNSDDTEEGYDRRECMEGREPMKLITRLEDESKQANGLSKRAALFFDQDIFKDIDSDLHKADEEGDSDRDNEVETETSSDEQITTDCDASGLAAESDSEWEDELKTMTLDEEIIHTEESDDCFEVVPQEKDDHYQGDSDMDLDTESRRAKKGTKADINIVTAEAMTLAHQLATGAKTKDDLLDSAYNRYSFQDTQNLPQWFLDDESKHSQPIKPISASAAAAIKEKIRALNARPIKKVVEAKARKKYKAMKKLENLKKKSALLADEEGMTEREKAQSISKMMNKASSKIPRKKVQVVVARGGNKGKKGRPKGVKGRYKIVDARLKKDVRAMKRAEKKR